MNYIIKKIRQIAFEDELEKIALSPELLNRASERAANIARKLIPEIESNVEKNQFARAKELIEFGKIKAYQGTRLGHGALKRTLNKTKQINNFIKLMKGGK